MTDRAAPQTTSQQAVLDGYAALHLQLQEMLALARRKEWPALTDLENDYARRVQRLAALDAEAALDDTQRARKHDLLARIVASEQEVRRRLSARRDELGELIGLTQRQRNLSRAYGVEANMANEPANPRATPDKRTP